MLSKEESIDSEHSISRYISGLREGNTEATQKIWERYIQRLVQLANRKLGSIPRSSIDGEDVVQQAFSEFFLQVQQGKFPQLHDRDDLWQVLAMLVDRRAKDQIRHRNSLRAGGGKVVNGTSFQNQVCRSNDPTLAVPSRAPSVSEAVEFVETLRIQLARLKNDDQRKLALLKLQGYSNREIADRINSSLRTVERMLSGIRSRWQNESGGF